MYYLLNDRYCLRGWRKLPFALVDRGTGRASFLRRADMALLLDCDGSRDLDGPDVPDALRAAVGAALDREVEVDPTDEIGNLGAAFNKMLDDLNDHIRRLTSITAEKERIGAELDIATHIQASMLPCIFPAFPDREEFDIYATMDPAKEVGSDFYDFFMVDDTHLAVVVADVSGKGVPAALFMVIGKTLIKDHTTPGRDLGEVFMEVNRLLCESNSEEMFITAFEGVLDLETGELRFVNAGHETPFICKKGGKYTPQKVRAGFVLAGMEQTRYKMGTLTLGPGDKLFQYTDGVPEATNAHNELYGMERLAAVLDQNSDAAPAALLPAVKADIDAFVGEAPQFDDITMLCLEYKQRMNARDPKNGPPAAPGRGEQIHKTQDTRRNRRYYHEQRQEQACPAGPARRSAGGRIRRLRSKNHNGERGPALHLPLRHGFDGNGW